MLGSINEWIVGEGLIRAEISLRNRDSWALLELRWLLDAPVRKSQQAESVNRISEMILSIYTNPLLTACMAYLDYDNYFASKAALLRIVIGSSLGSA